MTYLGYIISLFTSLFYSLKHCHKFGISNKEKIGLAIKSANLALCYTSFANRGRFSHYKNCGLAGFFSCTYDVITDWKNYDINCKKKYFSMIDNMVESAEIKTYLHDMYSKDFNNILNDDGLERGEISLKLILMFIGNTKKYEDQYDLKELGYMLQITDDLLDIENDLKYNELNCIKSSRGPKYLIEYKQFFLKNPDIFKESPIMKFIIKKSLSKIDTIDTILNTKLLGNEIS